MNFSKGSRWRTRPRAVSRRAWRRGRREIKRRRMTRRIYLDHNASSPLRPEAREAMVRGHGARGGGRRSQSVLSTRGGTQGAGPDRRRPRTGRRACGRSGRARDLHQRRNRSQRDGALAWLAQARLRPGLCVGNRTSVRAHGGRFDASERRTSARSRATASSTWTRRGVAWKPIATTRRVRLSWCR